MTAEELDELEISIEQGELSPWSGHDDVLRLIAIARAALALEADGINSLFIWFDDDTNTTPRCVCCGTKHESVKDFIHADDCVYAAFVKVLKG